MLGRPFLLSIGILMLATAAAVAPLFVCMAVLAWLVSWLVWVRPVWGLVLAVLATVPAEFARVSLGSLSVLPLDIVAPLVLLVWVVQRLLRREPIHLTFSGGAIVVFWLVALASLLFGAHALTGGEVATAALQLMRFIAISGLFFIAQSVSASDRHLVFRVLVATVMLLAVTGFIILRLIPDFGAAGLAAQGWDPHIGRLTGPWLDPNFAGGAFAFFLALLGAQFLHTRDVGRQAVYLGIAGVLLIALLLTVSRSGLLAFGIAGLVLGLVRSRVLLAAGVCLMALGAVAVPRVGERLGELLVTLTSFGAASQQVMDPTAALRVGSWAEGWRIFVEQPFFGVGYGAYAAHQTFVPATSHAASASDSSMLTIAATTGVVGLIVFSTILVSWLCTAWRRRTNPMALGFLAGFAGLFVHAIIVNSLLFAPMLLYVCVVTGMMSYRTHD